ncbi:dihydrolipoamide acetyltransferase family protein [Meiothermus taiwanensis]|jgi:2-oxoisovalerate dehydrogenase E2 component (dihydrolipoyl transacylase)|uniref:Dihydrolipoamide acetyltransferase component of pyruvate dehydrogenase complex n=2 Tax=Meiothermus taiwanensis TaxID=172827 RepID=A0A399E478_9DEIN|nr:dihydrolipoamide acetyltransferase family protein [Meiothermus taiwanensis]AWR85990.1 pyruvate dehydrogenase E2 component [Meiothermus taiwanensis WR-220]KIQ54765.1 branched-chain alpha-keto acid dehydrogenase subunit E2 [Meiothermus taiwanensis]KZK15947.1 branched-chain alpha-keto acid dehydrogenase subunit E2 [Meiothermus taiwanensis]RIH79534.1 Dihydrolipoyllysine-residue acetyltransferase component of pyruvate dehydrogenase complex [Meiothermus taiwanensis]
MPKEVVLPELAESVVEGEILRWLVNEGDFLKKDQPFVEVMTDKVTVELPSPYEGVLLQKLVKEGQVVPVHAPIALIAEPGEVAAAVGDQKPAPAPSLQAQEERSIVEPGQVAEDDGASLSLFKPDNKPEQVKNPFVKAAPLAVSGPSTATVQAHGRVIAVPAARKLARELGLDIAQIPGSGPNGRVRVEDVKAYAEQTSRATPPAAAPSAPERAAPLLGLAPVQYKTPKGYEGLETRVPLRGLRRAIAQQMMASHLYTVRTLSVDEVDMTELVALRNRLKPEAEAQGVRLSYLPFIFKAVAVALKKFPALNSSLDEARQEVVLKHYVNIGMAVAAENGLIVPVVRDVERKSLLQIAREVGDLAEKARSGKLAPEEVSGSTFSITNIGSIGALFSFPIINVPDAAILGVHSIQKRPVVGENDEIVVRQMMYLSLSFDHRLVDGAEAARFTKEVIRLLEKPERLFLEAL